MRMFGSIATLFLVGCPSADSGGVAVRGKVEYFGQPLAGGMIVFTPDADRGESGSLGSATIEQDGTYALKPAEGTGMKPGWYRVTVAPPPGVGERFPSHFRNPQSSGLTREVKRGEENVIEFTLQP